MPDHDGACRRAGDGHRLPRGRDEGGVGDGRHGRVRRVLEHQPVVVRFDLAHLVGRPRLLDQPVAERHRLRGRRQRPALPQVRVEPLRGQVHAQVVDDLRLEQLTVASSDHRRGGRRRRAVVVGAADPDDDDRAGSSQPLERAAQRGRRTTTATAIPGRASTTHTRRRIPVTVL